MTDGTLYVAIAISYAVGAVVGETGLKHSALDLPPFIRFSQKTPKKKHKNTSIIAKLTF
jgi:hypothetical protein